MKLCEVAPVYIRIKTTVGNQSGCPSSEDILGDIHVEGLSGEQCLETSRGVNPIWLLIGLEVCRGL